MFLQCVSTVIIVYITISPLNSYLYIHWILDFKQILHTVTGAEHGGTVTADFQVPT